jgi:hypothetical protein
MMAARLGPFAKQRREVAVVEGDEDPIITSRERKHIGIVETDQCRLLRDGADVVAGIPQAPTDLSSRDVLVKQQSHRG